MNRTILSTFAALLLSVSSGAFATAITYSGGSGTHSASASFEIVGGQLQVVLTNTSTADTLVPTDLLTALFFNIAGNPLLSRTSVVTGATSATFLNGAQISGGGAVVGGEYGYVNGLAQYGANSGISNSGLGLFGPGSVFPGGNLDGPVDPDGPGYGLASALDNPATGNGGILSNPITRNSVTVSLGALPVGFSLSSISNITFQYGTALDEGHFGGSSGGGSGNGSVPEPATVGLVGLGLVLAALGRRRRLR